VPQDTGEGCYRRNEDCSSCYLPVGDQDPASRAMFKKTKTWFLAPDFTFSPDALGTVIPDPSRPSVALAALGPDHPTIRLPETRTIVEKNRVFADEKSRSAGLELFAKFVELAEANGKADRSWFQNKSYSQVDHEIRAYNGPFDAESLLGIVSLPAVKRHVESGVFGKRPVYLISGLRVIRESFTVTDETGSSTAVALTASGPVPAGPVPVELGGSLSRSKEEKLSMGYDTAPDIVFAYRVHVLRPKGDFVEAELFSSKAAFFSGGQDSTGGGAGDMEVELAEVDVATLRQDLDMDLEVVEHLLGEGRGASHCVAFKPGA